MSDDVEMKDSSANHDAADQQQQQPDATTDDQQPLQSPLPSFYLDALPYLDTAYSSDASLKEQVQSLLQEEMSALTRTPEEYLQDWMQHRAYQEGYQQFETPFLTTAFTSLSSGAKPSPSSSSAASAAGLDLSRYKLDPPAGEDPVEWRKAIENAQAQLEHQTNRAVNLELLKKFGATKWKIHNEQVAQLKTKLAAELEEAKSRVEQINRKRKTEQVAAGQELSQLEHGYYDLVYKNHQIETANWQLEKKLRGETTAKEQ